MVEATAPRLIHDPGILNDSDLMEDVLAAIGSRADRAKSITEGVMRVNGDVVRLGTILFDTGALHRSYVSEDLVNSNRGKWGSKLVPVKSVVRLADQKTTKESKEELEAEVEVAASDGSKQQATLVMVVWNMPGVDMIIGLPDISKYFKETLVDMLANVEIVSDLEPGEVIQWSEGIRLESEEELNTEVPCSFTEALNFMEVSHEEALKVYEESLDKHIGDFLKSSKRLRAILESDMAKSVFVPSEWTGMKGFPELDLKFKPTFPESHRIRSRPINPKLYENAKKEFDRLKHYMYKDSTSPWASPLVIAPKATAPFIRFCGDYRWLNPMVVLPQAYIPHVQHEIEKAMGFKVFLDIDMTNSFHQLVLSEETGRRLAVQTPWGLVQPRFLPEGVSPASGYLQSYVIEMFSDFSDWAITIFDNILLLAHDEEDACNKLQIFLERCASRNVILKMQKTWLGFSSVKFFGYKVSYGKYEMDDDRKKAIDEFTMPTSQKGMQRFLGAALFFKGFVPNYSKIAAPLHEMTHNEFNWKESTWTKDYKASFLELKAALVNSTANHFPDYDLPWILRVDASDVAVGAVLFQERTDQAGNTVHEPIAFASQKFTAIAFKWDAFKKEAYAAYFGVHYFSYYLRGKPFILETDHRNLLWIEKSEVPIVVRWRVYMQSFIMYVRHIPGTQNRVADWLSRMERYFSSEKALNHMTSMHSDISVLLHMGIHHEPVHVEEDPHNHYEHWSSDKDLPPPEANDTLDAPQPTVVDVDPSAVLPAVVTTPVVERAPVTPEELLRKVHGGRNLHYGARRTWLLLNKQFPGHRIPYRFVQDFISTCAVCQKDRLGMTDGLQPVVRHIKPPHQRSRVGVDRLTVTPPDRQGNTTLVVIVEHFTKHVAVYPAKDYTAQTLAVALFQYFTTFGVFEEVWSDPGSDLMSEMVQQLNKWLGIKHVVSLVDRHESNGVEGTNKQLLRHLKTLVHDERVIKKWSDPTILCLVTFALNDAVNSETGVRPFDAKFGSDDGPYLKLPDSAIPSEITNAWVRALDQDLRHIRAVSARFQAELIAERLAATPEDTQNVFQEGDLVLFRLNPDNPLPTKMSSPFLGPYKVIQQYKNDVECRHLVMGNTKWFHVTQLKIFHGTEEEGFKAALLDADQHVIRRILRWKGDPMKRTTMEFKVEFEDDDILWLPYTKDLDESVQFGNFIEEQPYLFPLRYKASDATKRITALRKEAITAVQPLDIVYVELRCAYGLDWYDTLSIPNKYDVVYVVTVQYIKWRDRHHRFIQPKVLVLDEVMRDWDNYDVISYGSKKTLTDDMYVIDESFVVQHPEIIDPKHRDRLLKMYATTA